jgi:hypothetical protein
MAMGEEIVTMGLALRPVARVVRADGPDWATHTDRGSHPDQYALKPFGAFETAMNQPAVITNRMTGAERYCAKHQEHRESAPRNVDRRQRERGNEHAAVPNRSERIPSHVSGDGIGIRANY